MPGQKLRLLPKSALSLIEIINLQTKGGSKSDKETNAKHEFVHSFFFLFLFLLCRIFKLPRFINPIFKIAVYYIFFP